MTEVRAAQNELIKAVVQTAYDSYQPGCPCDNCRLVQLGQNGGVDFRDAFVPTVKETQECMICVKCRKQTPIDSGDYVERRAITENNVCTECLTCISCSLSYTEMKRRNIDWTWEAIGKFQCKPCYTYCAWCSKKKGTFGDNNVVCQECMPAYTESLNPQTVMKFFEAPKPEPKCIPQPMEVDDVEEEDPNAIMCPICYEAIEPNAHRFQVCTARADHVVCAKKKMACTYMVRKSNGGLCWCRSPLRTEFTFVCPDEGKGPQETRP